MSYLDEPEYDDRARDSRSGDDRSRDDRHRDDRSDDPSRDSRGAGGRRASQPARPAWDAATYGTPDDLRRSRPPSSPRSRPTPGYTPDPYPAEPYQADPYQPDPYQPEPYPVAPYSADPYPAAAPASPYASPQAYASDTYSPDTYSPDTYSPDKYSSDSYSPSSVSSAGMYAPEPYPDTDPYAAGSVNSTGGFDSGRHDNGGYDHGGGYEQSGGYEHGAGYEQGSGYEQGGGYEPRRSARPDHGGPAERYPGGLPSPEPGAPVPSGGRAGRNLPAAIGVGVLLGGIAVASLFVWRPAFLGVVVIAVGIGVWELVRAIRTSGAQPPLIPLLAGSVLMAGLAWWGHADALTFGLMVTVLAAMVWRLADGPGDYGRDVTAATLVAVYVPFLAGFMALLATPPDGDLRVIVTLAGVVLSDTGGYIAGVLFGRHPMAPTVSPKKSWEGLVGSLVASGVGGALLLHFLLHVSFLWGAVFGLAVCVAAVVGDLGESMLKRDLGVKDMSNLLPGHGGLMDRLDSILLAAPTAYILLLALAPPR